MINDAKESLEQSLVFTKLRTVINDSDRNSFASKWDGMTNYPPAFVSGITILDEFYLLCDFTIQAEIQYSKRNNILSVELERQYYVERIAGLERKIKNFRPGQYAEFLTKEWFQRKRDAYSKTLKSGDFFSLADFYPDLYKLHKNCDHLYYKEIGEDLSYRKALSIFGKKNLCTTRVHFSPTGSSKNLTEPLPLVLFLNHFIVQSALFYCHLLDQGVGRYIINNEVGKKEKQISLLAKRQKNALADSDIIHDIEGLPSHLERLEKGEFTQHGTHNAGVYSISTKHKKAGREILTKRMIDHYLKCFWVKRKGATRSSNPKVLTILDRPLSYACEQQINIAGELTHEDYEGSLKGKINADVIAEIVTLITGDACIDTRQVQRIKGKLLKDIASA